MAQFMQRLAGRSKQAYFFNLKPLALNFLPKGLSLPPTRRVHMASPSRQAGLSRELRLRARRARCEKHAGSADQCQGADADCHSQRNQKD